MSRPFQFKQFTITQDVNPQKVGTDSVLLGAWTSGDYSRILDIGTGTGILALMMAQTFENAEITAIEPDLQSLNEAKLNFNESIFSNRIMAIHAPLQSFGAIEKYDLIICNPPYYDGSYISEDPNRNRARHTSELRIDELYEFASDLLSEDGKMNVIVPYTEETEHIERAFDNDLYVQKILHTVKSDGSKKRTLISFGFEEIDPDVRQMLVKDENNNYSKEYIELTEAFYTKDLSLT